MTDLSVWSVRAAPDPDRLVGSFCTLDRFAHWSDPASLFAAIGGDNNAALWTHVPAGPFHDAGALGDFLDSARLTLGWRTLAVRIRAASEPSGMLSLMRIRPEHGSAEVGCVVFSRSLQKTPAATEAIYLVARHLFEDLGYRRFEWKCDAENDASRRAAIRFGFRFEGVFRQDMVMKGRNRDTAWFSMIDREWPSAKAAFEAWLSPTNFGADGRQKARLVDLRGA